MAGESDAFYVVQKGKMIGVYNNLSDVQALLRSSGNDTFVRVFKGNSLSTVAEEYMTANGLKNPTYCLNVGDMDVLNAVFGQVVCPVSSTVDQSVSTDNFRDVASYCAPCILEFAGVSKGNPGESRAGAVLRVEDRNKVFRLREGVGVATKNFSHYRGLILGLRFALQEGYKHIHVKGHCELVCKQTSGEWKKKNRNMAELSNVVKELKDQFLSFRIGHIQQVVNCDAIDQANLGVDLKSGRVQVEVIMN